MNSLSDTIAFFPIVCRKGCLLICPHYLRNDYNYKIINKYIYTVSNI